MRASVVIRVRDEADALRRLRVVLARQTEPHEVIVVRDGRSRDAEPADVVADPFSFGGALNLGAERASAEVVVALSAHALPRDDAWLGRMIAAFEDPAVACAFGPSHDWSGAPLRAPVRQDAVLALKHPRWGYSNGAGAFRRSLWARRPFRDDMPGSEDREWALWALQGGFAALLDPALAVDHDHSRDGIVDSFRRYEREARGDAMFLPLPPHRPLHEWWTDQGWHRSKARARLDPRRAARLAGTWWGRR